MQIPKVPKRSYKMAAGSIIAVLAAILIFVYLAYSQ